MSSEKLDSTKRRSVLKTATAAVVGAVGAAGVSTADVGTEGICIVANSEANVYNDACPLGDQIDTIQEGDDGELVDRCTDNYDATWEYVDWDNTDLKDGWVEESNLDEC